MTRKDTDYQETRYGRQHDFERAEYSGWNLKEPDFRGRYVLMMIERWGMVAGTPDGEDSSGRSKLRLATTTELVNRATETIKLTFDRLEELGWMVERLSFKEAEEFIKDKENGKEGRN